VSERRYAVVAGGGTAGHILPALAVARALAARGHERATIEMVGSRRGQEAALLGDEGFPLTLLEGRGIARSLSPRALLDNARAVLGLLYASAKAIASMRCWRPAVVVAVGGYASFPAAVAAVVLRRPLVLVNVDAVPGAVNSLFGRAAAASAVAFEGTDLPRAVVTGTPVRDEILATERDAESSAAARRTLGVPAGRSLVAVVGGSLGARRINAAAAGLATRWAGRADLALFHVTGRRDYEQFAGAPTPRGEGLWHEMVPYEERMALLYAAADVMVCRAGAMTVAELTEVGVPSVLVPLPGAPRDHQRANAMALVRSGAAILVPDEDCDAERLDATLGALLADAGALGSMETAARKLGRPDAAERVADVVERHARS